MYDPLRPPTSDTGCLRGQLFQFLQILQQLIIEPSLLYVILQQGGISELRTSVIHDLIKYLIDETKLLLDVVLGDLAIAVGLADKDELIEKLDGHCSVYVGLGGGQEDEILVWDGDVRNPIEEKDRIVSVFLGGDHLRAIVLDLGTSDVVLEGAVYQDLSLDVYEHH